MDGGRDKNTIALTHVCQAWREVFTSRSSLWTNLHCKNSDKTRVYLERSNSSPINISLDAVCELSPVDPFFQVIPRAIGRLTSLFVCISSTRLRDITPHLSRPAPLLQKLSVFVACPADDGEPALPSTLFDGDLSSLRKLRLMFIHTELPWRNMVNLTSFSLAHTTRGNVTVGQLLDFLESAPQLREVYLYLPISTSGAQDGRLVSLACLKTMEVACDKPSLLLNHLLIPVGTKLKMEGELFDPLIEGYLSGRLRDNLRNLPNFTTVRLSDSIDQWIAFSGPNGEVKMASTKFFAHGAWSALESLPQFDTSKVERLRIGYNKSASSDPPYRALLPIKGLRTLTLVQCKSPDIFISALDPNGNSSGDVVCPKLEEIIVYDGSLLDINGVTRMAAARALRGSKLKSLKLICDPIPAEIDILELRKHVSHLGWKAIE